jgi:succinyl-CoA synthetase alpha subunit
MAILLDERSRVMVHGLTGREGSFHALRNRAYGTQVVAGVTPGKGGRDVEGIPVFDTAAAAVAGTGADVSLVFVPPRFAADALYEAADAGVRLIIAITEGIPVHEMLALYGYLRCRGVRLIGPNCPGIISPGRANAGIIPPQIFRPGPVGLVSRSGTLTYQIASELTARGLGQSTAVGIGGDAIAGSSFIDVLAEFEHDPQTEAVVLVGEIGGSEEEAAASYIGEQFAKPVVAYIAGFTAPPGRRMGHAGAIISGSAGTAQAKQEALEAVGIQVAIDPSQVGELVAAVLAGPRPPRP